MNCPGGGEPCRVQGSANLAATRANTFQIRRFASQTKPMQDCHPERSEGSLSGQRSFAALRMTKRDGLFFEMYWTLGHPVWGQVCQVLATPHGENQLRPLSVPVPRPACLYPLLRRRSRLNHLLG